MIFLLALLFAVVVYLLLGATYTTRVILRYRAKFDRQERRTQAEIDGDTWKTAVHSFFVTTLTWPRVMRYIERETQRHFLVERFENDRALAMRGL